LLVRTAHPPSKSYKVTRVGRYEILEELGCGGSATVFKAR